MGQNSSRMIDIKGTVAPGFESVKQMFAENFSKGREENAQLCVYVGEEKVVDLWGSTTDKSYTADTLTTIFSSSKSLTAIALAAMYDKGLIKYDAKIAEYWPEFAQNGKEDVTIADLMRHEAGLAYLTDSLTVEDTLTKNIKQNSIGSVIEKQKLQYPAKGKRQYHAMTRGWIANEVFRRVHPNGDTIGEYLRKDIRSKLGADVFVGVDDSIAENYAPVKELPFSFVLGQSLIPKCFGRKVDGNIFEIMSFMKKAVGASKKTEGQKPAFSDFKGVAMEKSLGNFFNIKEVRNGETPSCNGLCSARGMNLREEKYYVFNLANFRSCSCCGCYG